PVSPAKVVSRPATAVLARPTPRADSAALRAPQLRDPRQRWCVAQVDGDHRAWSGEAIDALADRALHGEPALADVLKRWNRRRGPRLRRHRRARRHHRGDLRPILSATRHLSPPDPRCSLASAPGPSTAR